MSRLAVGRVTIAIGVLAFLHSAFSAYEFLTVRKSFGLPQEPIPADIASETLISFLVLVVGITLSTAPLREITWSSEMRTQFIDSADTRPGFARFDHRGPALFASARALIGESEKSS